ncbi:MAG: TIGR02221 family CRISPR-associated protein [Candidatus Lokiarchaeota archaeon]|nr:TIGR02221 family CRISPR-associated protein [Candidatus Lokiarchaeota archaeon]
MSRLFLTFLGTYDYIRCNYQNPKSGGYIEGERFVQIALIKSLCTKWTEEDKIIIFLTKLARASNWNDNGQIDRKIRERLPRLGLKNAIQNLKLPIDIQAVDIHEGKTESELWENFNIIISQLNDGDEIYYDITHSFRSLPLLVAVVLIYSRIVKNIKIKGVYYGAFETLGSQSAVEKMPEDERNAPIFDLEPFIALLDWSFATDSFLKSGDTIFMKTLIDQEINPILRKTKGRDRIAKLIKELINNLNALSLNIKTCRGNKLIEQMDFDHLKQTIESLEDLIQPKGGVNVLPPFLPLISLILNKVKAFRNEDIQNGLAAVKWCIDHKLAQQGITILQETMVNMVINVYSESEENSSLDLHNLRDRQVTGNALNYISAEEKKQKSWEFCSNKHREQVLRYADIINIEYAKIYDGLSQLRNDINHSGFLRDQAIDAVRIMEKLREYYEEVSRIKVKQTNERDF